MKRLHFFMTQLLLGSFLLTSCLKNAPKAPVDETLNKDHGTPKKAEMVLYEGIIDDKGVFNPLPEIQGVQYLTRKQKITYTLTSKGWGAVEGTPAQFLVKAAERHAAQPLVYALWLRYFDARGEEITEQFVQNGQELLHQHFFVPKKIITFPDKVADEQLKPTDLYHYTYADSAPWDKSVTKEGATLIGNKNPIGMKGYFSFFKKNYQFELNIELLHAAISKFNSGVTSPFYAPSPAQRQRDHWDLKIKVPVIVYAAQSDVITAPSNAKEQDIAASEMQYLHSIASAYGISWQQALLDWNLLINNPIDATQPLFWL